VWYRKKIAELENEEERVYRYPLNIPISNELRELLQALAADGKHGLVVGGAVRDGLMGISPKDIDIEVYGFLPSNEFLGLGKQWDVLAEKLKFTNPESPEYPKLQQEFTAIQEAYAQNSPLMELAKELGRYPQFGKVAASEGGIVGKSFGVIKFVDNEGNDYDFSLPRKESKTGGGHTSFRPVFGNFSPVEAAARRDFTFNAMGYDPLTEQLHDYFGGKEDLENKIIRHTSTAFSEDPLRILRGMQFAARYGFKVAPETAELGKEMAKDFARGKLTLEPQESKYWNGAENVEEPTISRERIAEEIYKMLTKGKNPSDGLRFLVDTGWIKFFPEISALYGVPQDPEYHPEGDASEHTMHVMDAMREIADREGLNDISDLSIHDERAILMLAAMLHDIAKPQTTQQRDKKGVMRWTSYGHESAGGPVAEKVMRDMGIKENVIRAVKSLIENHMKHISFGPNPSQKAVNELAQRLHRGGTNIDRLMNLIEADNYGRPPLPKEQDPKAIALHEMAKKLGVNRAPLVPFIQGRDIISVKPDIKPGPMFGQIIDKFYALQMSGAIKTREEALAKLADFFNRKEKYVPKQN
jgi:tRNA nucleotidyltransferase (CCA-adding enzyme)